MLYLEPLNIAFIIIISIVIIVCCIGIIISSNFQKRQKDKYKKCLQIIKEKSGNIFEVKDGLSKDEILSIDPNINLEKLMNDLYEKFILLEKCINNKDKKELKKLTIGYIKKFFESRFDAYNNNGYCEITENIDLMNYSIIEFSLDALKFRITINCVNYKKFGEKIVSGSSLAKIQEIFIVSYEKRDNEWLITKVEKIFQKKLSN